MTSKPSLVATTLLAAAATLAACGNYSNEDLEFMNAAPDSQQLTTDLPPRPLSTPIAMEAELAADTHAVSNTFNTMIDGVLGLVDLIRTFQPTSRGDNSRTWGPVPSSDQPGWDWRFTVTRVDPQTFSYVLDFQDQSDPSGTWILFLSGMFQASAGARRGDGSLHAETPVLRRAGFPFKATDTLDTMDVEYSTLKFPFTVDMQLTAFPNAPGDLMTVNAATYSYGVQSNGQGAMSFSFTNSMNQTLNVVSRWLATGTGIATATVMTGTGAGLTQTECWDDAFRATYNDKPWKTSEDLGAMSACPAIPTL
jgi:hypothetical protein